MWVLTLTDESTCILWKHAGTSGALGYSIPYSTEITPTPEIKPTPTFDWTFLHRLICLENTPTRKWCICQWAVVKKSFMCKLVSSEYTPICKYKRQGQSSLNLCWRLWCRIMTCILFFILFFIPSRLATLPMHYYCCILMYFKSWQADRISSWVGVISRQNYCFASKLSPSHLWLLCSMQNKGATGRNLGRIRYWMSILTLTTFDGERSFQYRKRG